jgi:hypothetical protein
MDGSRASATASAHSTATASSERGGNAKAFAARNSTASAIAGGPRFAFAWAIDGATAIAGFGPPQCLAPPGQAKVESSAGNCQAGF